jgi:hypothetical protein
MFFNIQGDLDQIQKGQKLLADKLEALEGQLRYGESLNSPRKIAIGR